MTTIPLAQEVAALCRRFEAEVGPDDAARIAQLRARLDGPLRIAIAGRVKAGKSTLLNALVGERLAPTDAGECTKIISWYQHATGYSVTAEGLEDATYAVPFTRVDGALSLDLAGLPAIERLRIGWPSRALESMTLVDTPGLGSIDDESSRRSLEFLAADPDDLTEPDAVVYLTRHLHRSDVEFLGSYMDSTVPGASPVNSITVLSRADEIAPGRPDAMEAAAKVAERYAADPTIRALTGTVVPVAGLLAETGATLTEDEFEALRAIAALDAEERAWLLLSADQFREPDRSPLLPATRERLLDRLGVFGLVFAVGELASGRAASATDLSSALLARSGLHELTEVVVDRFLPRARVLQAGTALASLDRIGRDVADRDAGAGERIRRAVEELRSRTLDLALLRAAHLVLSGLVELGVDARTEIAALTLGAPMATGTDPAAAIAAVERWRRRGADPLASPTSVEVCETMARYHERAAAAPG